MLAWRFASHRDKQHAVSEAKQVLRLGAAEQVAQEAPPTLTLGTLFGRYVSEGRLPVPRFLTRFVLKAMSGYSSCDQRYT